MVGRNVLRPRARPAHLWLCRTRQRVSSPPRHANVKYLATLTLLLESWRWSMWEIVWLAGLILVLLVVFLPETSTPTLLFYKAKRLRQETGSERFVTVHALRSKSITRRELVRLALIKPFEITIKDPAIAFTNIYVSPPPCPVDCRVKSETHTSCFANHALIGPDFPHLRHLLLFL